VAEPPAPSEIEDKAVEPLNASGVSDADKEGRGPGDYCASVRASMAFSGTNRRYP
jgi:hypothetical protein